MIAPSLPGLRREIAGASVVDLADTYGTPLYV